MSMTEKDKAKVYAFITYKVKELGLSSDIPSIIGIICDNWDTFTNLEAIDRYVLERIEADKQADIADLEARLAKLKAS